MIERRGLTHLSSDGEEHDRVRLVEHGVVDVVQLLEGVGARQVRVVERLLIRHKQARAERGTQRRVAMSTARPSACMAKKPAHVHCCVCSPRVCVCVCDLCEPLCGRIVRLRDVFERQSSVERAAVVGHAPAQRPRLHQRRGTQQQRQRAHHQDAGEHDDGWGLAMEQATVPRYNECDATGHRKRPRAG